MTESEHRGKREEPEPQSLDPLTNYSLERFTRVVRKEQLPKRYLAPDDRRMHLINHAKFSFYDDLRELGVKEIADKILAQRYPLPHQESEES